MTAIPVLAFRSVIADFRRSLLYVLTISSLLMIISAPIAIANGYSENLRSMLPKYEQEKLLLVNASASSLSDSILDYSIAERVAAMGFRELFPQLLFYSKVSFNYTLFDVRIKGIDRLDEYFKRSEFRINGSIPISNSEVIVGVLIARRFGIERDASIKILLSSGSFREYRVSGIIECRCPSDEDILMHLHDAWDIMPDYSGKISFIELINLGKVDLNALYSLDTEVLDIKPFHQAFHDLVFKTFNSIRNWSIPVYILVLVAVYFIAMKIARESERDVVILRCIGASRRKAFSYLFCRCLVIITLGIITGLALGVTFAQVIFRLLSIILSTGSYIPPSLYVSDVAWIISFSLLLSISGALYPIIKEVRRNLGELTWQHAYP